MSPFDPAQVKALTFDVFGTVVDYRSTIVRELDVLARAKSWAVDTGKFADAWRGRYRPGIDRVRLGEVPFQNVDQIMAEALEELLREFQLGDLAAGEREALNRVWHRLDPWPDAVEGLTRLKKKFMVCSLSNASVAQLVNMSKHAGLPWDCTLCAEMLHAYKPDPQTYLGTAQLLGLAPPQVMMVAAHPSDLRAAQACGLRAAYVRRPLEFGPDASPEPPPDPAFEFTAEDFLDLARQLGC